jgi:hypothetical protein
MFVCRFVCGNLWLDSEVDTFKRIGQGFSAASSGIDLIFHALPFQGHESNDRVAIYVLIFLSISLLLFQQM